MPMNYKRALAYVTKHLQKFALNGAKAHVYDFADGNVRNIKRRPFAGIRVAEVSFATAMAGCSFMSSDLDGLTVCAQTERCLLGLCEGWSQEEVDEEFDRLDYLLRLKD